ncbi:nucleoporin Nup120/160-domain-containing protein [Cantharellus anzutake]|uniref:nucleoporin Nup120/160-domain-containing protein n=1 Tax=Cantharellus anzutake TaxID=1750568 RepID=UPI001904E2C6|nr:nucleoporin Nup120/160-domain-containing protein [Cantharellus anzutake]KAF8335076.1 nucleoporin Nup120/160-domain-containing protein [Cantharellus anzutake]
MQSSFYTLATAHISSILPVSRANVRAIQSQRLPEPLKTSQLDTTDVLPEHATEGSILCEPQAHVLLRVLHGRRTIELSSLSTDAPPTRFSFPSRLFPTPSVVFDDPEVHIIALTEDGSVYRMVFQTPKLWSDDYASRNWISEYHLKHSPENITGPLHVKEAGSIFIGLRDGGILNLDAVRISSASEFSAWKETILRPPLSLTLTSLIPFTRPRQGSSHTISFATVPNPSPSLVVFSLHRDRTLRVWETGVCVASIGVPAFIPDSSVREASSSRTATILGPEPRRLLQVIPPEEGDRIDEALQILVFMPQTQGGSFSLYGLSEKNNGGQRSLEYLWSKNCSEPSQYRQLRDFIVTGDTLWVLWDDAGSALVEYTDFDVEGEVIASSWNSVNCDGESYFPSPRSEEKNLPQGSFTDSYLRALLQPGSFSKYTLRAALQQYSSTLMSVPGAHHPILSTTYQTLAEQIASVVGCTVDLVVDPQTGEQLWVPYWNTLRRDWEGFLARCREIERQARWPLQLGVSYFGEPLLIERERLCAIVKTDKAMQLHQSVTNTNALQIPGTVALSRIAHTLRESLGSAKATRLDQSILDVVRSDPKSSYLDLMLQVSQGDIMKAVPTATLTWVNGQLAHFSDVEGAIVEVLQALVSLDTVKLEQDEETESIDAPPLSWQTALLTSFIATSIKARYDIILPLFTLLAFIIERDRDSQTGWRHIAGQAFVAVQSISLLHHIAISPAGDPEATSARLADDDVASLMRNMTVSGYSRPRHTIAYSLLHVFLSSLSLSFPSHVPPSVAAHRYLFSTGLLRVLAAPEVSEAEVQLIHRIWTLGFAGIANEVAQWYPRSPAVAYLMGRTLLDLGRAEEAADLLETIAFCFGKQTAHSWDDELLRIVLPAGVSPDSLFSYWRHLIGVFDGFSLAAQVARFARLALECTDPLEVSDLWLRLFKADVDLGLYEDAYETIIRNPSNEQQSEFVRQLVTAMCENDEINRLLSLNFIGFQADVEQAILFKARNTDPRQKPDYAQVLHGWYIFRGDYRGAAAAMYQHSRRLGEIQLLQNLDFLEMGTLQAMSLLTSINALSLADTDDAWVEYIAPPSEASVRVKVSQHIPEEYFASAGINFEVVTISEMRREYTLLMSKLRLARESPNLQAALVRTLTKEDIIAHYVQLGLFDLAMSNARTFRLDMSSIFGILTSRCMRIAEQGDDDIDPLECPWLFTDQVLGWEGTNSQRAWRYLRLSLESYDSMDGDWSYHKVVLQKIIDLDRFSRVPAWLSKFFMDHQPEYLIRMSLKYGLVAQALSYSIAMVQRVCTAAPARVNTPQASFTWLPYNLIDQVLLAATEERKERPSRATDRMAQQLRKGLSARITYLEKWSKIEG